MRTIYGNNCAAHKNIILFIYHHHRHDHHHHHHNIQDNLFSQTHRVHSSLFFIVRSQFIVFCCMYSFVVLCNICGGVCPRTVYICTNIKCIIYALATTSYICCSFIVHNVARRQHENSARTRLASVKTQIPQIGIFIIKFAVNAVHRAQFNFRNKFMKFVSCAAQRIQCTVIYICMKVEVTHQKKSAAQTAFKIYIN